MELKKYVLLIESNEIMVVGVDIVKREWKEKGKFYGEMIEKSEMRVIAEKWNYPLKDLLYKTSDNILDLVEVGDLVGYRFWGEYYENIDKMRDEQNIKNDIKYNGNGFVIVAIYKRQTNGDYKRYEVKE